MNPWLHFGIKVHNSISARFRDKFVVGPHEKKTRQFVSLCGFLLNLAKLNLIFLAEKLRQRQ